MKKRQKRLSLKQSSFWALFILPCFVMAGYLYLFPVYQSWQNALADVEPAYVEAAATGQISTLSGGQRGTSFLATNASILLPLQIDVDSSGNYYVVESLHRIRRVDGVSGFVTNLIGSGVGVADSSGDGGLASDAEARGTNGVQVDSVTGDVYFTNNHSIRKIDGGSNIVTTIAGSNLSSGSSGDGGAATAARLYSPHNLALDEVNDKLYIADTSNHKVRVIDLVSGIINTYAGIGTPGSTGDGGLATAAELNSPVGIAIDSAGNVYVSESTGNRVRKIDAGTGIITTYAGTGVSGFSGDGGLATAAQISFPLGLVVDSSDNLFIADRSNKRVRRVDSGTGNISTYAGDGTTTVVEAVLATSSGINFFDGLGIDGSDNLYVSATGDNLVRKIDVGTNIINTVLGNGFFGFAGDGFGAINAEFRSLYGVEVDASGNTYIMDGGNRRLRKIDSGTGTISTIAGTGNFGGAGDGGAALSASLDDPYGMTIDSLGNIYFLERNLETIRRIDAGTGTITTIAGTAGVAGYNGDGIPAIGARIGNETYGLATDANNDLYIADQFNHRIRKISFGTGIITTIAGTGVASSTGDGGLATSATLNRPFDLAFDSNGDLFVSELLGDRVRKIDMTTGVISTYATSFGPTSIIFDSNNNLFGFYNSGIYRVASATALKTFLGGSSGFDGDTPKSFSSAKYGNGIVALAVDVNDDLVISDGANYRIRLLELPTDYCQDGVVGSSEQCDDGNASNGDGCSSACLVESVCTGGICNIADNATGGECTTVGTWDDVNNICTLSHALIDEIEIDNNGITLDCANFSLIGSGTNQAVRLVSGKDNVTIKNCVITDWATGIALDSGSDNNIIQNNTFSTMSDLTDRGVEMVTGTGNLVADNSFDNVRNSVLSTFGGTNTIQDNVITNGIAFGININSSSTNIVQGNQISSSGNLSSAIVIGSGSGNTVQNNYIRGSYSGNMIFVNDSGSLTTTNNDILNNTMLQTSGSATGISFSGISVVNDPTSLISGNYVIRSGSAGFGGLLLLNKYDNLTVQNNTVVGIGTSGGAAITLIDSDGIVISGNKLVKGTGGSASLSIGSNSSSGQISNNTIINMAGGGISIASGSNTFSINSNYICGNTLDVNNQGTGNSGSNNTCNTSSGFTCNNACPAATCGNGVLESGEVCDDGNATDAGSCNSTCTSLNVCGDGVVQQPNGEGIPEQCDDSNTVSGDGCSAFCFLEGVACGNGVVEGGEQCDDGNPFSGDGCSSACLVENIAPTAPTNLLINTIDATTAPTISTANPIFSAQCNDSDLGDIINKYRIQVSTDNTFALVDAWESGVAGTALSNCVAGNQSQDINFAGTPLSSNTTYYWRIKFFDDSGAEGAFSNIETFTTNSAPSAPTVLFVNSTNAQSGSSNPSGIDLDPVFSAVCNDPDAGDVMNKYRIQVSTQNDFLAGILWDSGALGTAMPNCTNGNRITDIAYGGLALANSTQYFWRIKFWDDDNTEGVFSEDPTATQTFSTAAVAGSGSVRVGISSPSGLSYEALSPTVIRWIFTDTTNNELGFRLLDAEGELLVQKAQPNISYIDETGLSPNTLYEGRKVVAYTILGQSGAQSFPAAATLIPAATIKAKSQTDTSVTLSINEVLPNIEVGLSGLRFELFTGETSVTAAQAFDSGWIKDTEYTFDNLTTSETYSARVTTRNQLGIENDSSSLVPVLTSEPLYPEMELLFSLRENGGSELSSRVSPKSLLTGQIIVKNNGFVPATEVFANLPLPDKLFFVKGSMQIDGLVQTDSADTDPGQGNNNAISAIWPSVDAQSSHVVSFQLSFDQVTLKSLRKQDFLALSPLKTVESAAELLTESLNASLSYAESVDVISSDQIDVVIDLTAYDSDIQADLEPTPVEPETEIPQETTPPQAISPQEQQKIEEIIQQQLAGGSNQVGSGPTNSQQENGNFSVDVTLDGQVLSITGSAFQEGGNVLITGTTNLPYTVVTLFFDNFTTRIVVSDENGIWETYVGAEDIGIPSGQTRIVSIDVIAAKGELISDRVKVADVIFTSAMKQSELYTFETFVSASSTVAEKIVNTLSKQAEHVQEIVVEQEEPIQAALSVAAPVIVVSSAPLWGYLPILPTLLFHFITWLLGLLGGRRKKEFFGIVYDSIRKVPLSLSIVRIYSAQTNKLVGTAVTDKKGRYELLLEPGKYRLEVRRPGYSFPTKLVSSSSDDQFEKVYQSEMGFEVNASDMRVPDIPMDPVNKKEQWQLASFMKKLWLGLQHVGNVLAVPALIIGAIISAVVVVAIPENLVNWIMVVLYVFLLSSLLRLRPAIEKAWGIVFDVATKQAIPLATIQLVDTVNDRVVKARLTDYQGRYSFLPELGTYLLRVVKLDYKQVDHPIHISNTNQHISADIALAPDSVQTIKNE